VSFPLADWIDGHSDCRHNLGRSGMVGTIRLPVPTARDVREADAGVLRREIADSIGVAADRVYLTHGATEANSLVALFLGLERSAGSRRLRVRLPEYPPMVDIFRWAGFRPVDGPGPASTALVSLPRNPEGDLWPKPRLEEWTEGVSEVVVDETFREFAGAGSVSSEGRRGWWSTGSFTKFYGADDLRVGYAVPPPERVERFATFHGLAADQVAPASVAGALLALRGRERIRRQVRAVLDRNVAAWRRAVGGPPPAAPVVFDRTGEDGDRLADRCLAASVLVCPGRFFGDPTGVRICLTRRSFLQDLRAYLGVRNARPRRASAGRATGRPRRGRAL
jgi:aspartate/methionine/tyrosine aminotransferase